MRKWYTTFLYNSYKTILGIKGKPAMDKFFYVCLRRTTDQIWHDKAMHPIYKKVLTADESDKATLAYQLGTGTT